MTITTLDLKKYLRISHNQDDEYISDLIELAKTFITEQTGVEYSEADRVFVQGVYFMVAHLYDNRSPLTDKTVNTVPYTLETILCHLKLRGANE